MSEYMFYLFLIIKSKIDVDLPDFVFLNERNKKGNTNESLI